VPCADPKAIRVDGRPLPRETEAVISYADKKIEQISDWPEQILLGWHVMKRISANTS